MESKTKKKKDLRSKWKTFKGWLLVERLKEQYEDYGWKVETWNPTAKGRDMVVTKHEPILVNEDTLYPGRIRVLEVINWSITSYMPYTRIRDILTNLNVEANRRVKRYKNYFIEKGLHYTHSYALRPYIEALAKDEVLFLQEREIDPLHSTDPWIDLKRVEFEKKYGEIKDWPV